jgi:hypothetical protein
MLLVTAEGTHLRGPCFARRTLYTAIDGMATPPERVASQRMASEEQEAVTRSKVSRTTRAAQP